MQDFTVQRFRPLITLLSLALLGADAIVGAAGHTHRQHDKASSAQACGNACGGGCCHNRGTNGQEKAHPAPRQSPDSTPHDDCALCRHFSQPVVPVVITLALEGSEQIEPFILRAVQHVVVTTTTKHPARGPPLPYA
jgi:hypothetical protein